MPRYAETTQYTEKEILLWEQLIKRQGVEFHTAKGLSFTYSIRGNELFISRKEKSITRSTVNMAYKKARELDGVVSGPKKLGTFGASYLYPVFMEIGVITEPQDTGGRKKSNSVWKQDRVDKSNGMKSRGD